MKRVLVADDHPFMVAGIEAVLRNTAFEIIGTAADGQKALVAVSRDDPDICLFDVRMPGYTGLEVLQALRTSGDTRPVVLLTADLTDDVLLAAIRVGVNGIVLKASAADDLLSCLELVAAGSTFIPNELLTRAVQVSINPSSNPLDALAPRERQITELVGRGLRNRDIADAARMTEGTIKVYLHGIYEKLGVANRTELALLAHGLTDQTGTANQR